MKFYFLNLIQLSYDFGKVIFSDITQEKVCLNKISKWFTNTHMCDDENVKQIQQLSPIWVTSLKLFVSLSFFN
jgi:hypothetical protein